MKTRSIRNRIHRSELLLACLATTLAFAPLSALGQPQTIEVDSGRDPNLAPDGSFMTYQCGDTDLRNFNKFCLYELETGVITEIVLPLDDIEPEWLKMSNNAEFITIYADDPNAGLINQIYVYDRLADTLELVSKNAAGEPGDRNNEYPNITSDGRYVVFESDSENFGFPQVNTDQIDLYRFDRQTDSLTVASRTWDGSPLEFLFDGQVYPHLQREASDVSDDGNRMVYTSDAVNLVPNDDNEGRDAFLYTHSADAVTRVSVDSNGDECDRPAVNDVSISGDGRTVAILAAAANRNFFGLLPCLDPDATEGSEQVFLRDLDAGVTFMVSGNPAGQEPACIVNGSPCGIRSAEGRPLISRDGRFTAFQSGGADIVANDTNESRDDIFVYDRLAGETTLQSIRPDGNQWSTRAPLSHFSMSDDGSSIAFSVYDDIDGEYKVYLRGRGDIFPPIVAQVRTDPVAPSVGESVLLQANVSDAFTGNQPILSAEYRVQGGDWAPMAPSDGSLDSSTEAVEAAIGPELSGGVQEVCVRATDALGWSSPAKCIELTVGGEAQVGLKIRCLHDPIYPAPGDTVTITAETIDQDGNPVAVGLIEIFRGGRETSSVFTGGIDQASAVMTASGDELIYGCAAERGSESAFSRFVTVDVGTPELNDAAAIPILYHGPTDEKIDLIFFADPDAYPNGPFDSGFQDDMWLLLWEGLFQMPWYVEYQWVLNIWLARDPADVTPKNPDKDFSLCAKDKPDNYKKLYGFADGDGIIHQEICRDNSLPLSPYTTTFGERRLAVVAHEIGHKAFALSDEYTSSPTIRFTTANFPNLFPTQTICEIAAINRAKDPTQCRQLPGFWNFGGVFIFEPDYFIEGDTASETPDLMQQTGGGPCSFDANQTCDRHRVGDSEEAKMFWKLGKCLEGKC